MIHDLIEVKFDLTRNRQIERLDIGIRELGQKDSDIRPVPVAFISIVEVKCRGCLIITSNSEMGDAFEELPAEREGLDLDISFNIRFMSDIMKVIEDDEVVLRFNSAVSPCVICPTEGDKFTYLVLPVRSA